MTPLVVTALSAVNCLGRGVDATYTALRAARSGLAACSFAPVATYTGMVAGVEDAPVAGALAEYDCRNHRLAQLALHSDGFAERVAEARGRYGAARIATVIGTSTSGILETEYAFQHRDPASGRLPPTFRYRTTHNLYSTADFVRRALGLYGPTVTVSTACSSSAKVFASAWRLLATGLVDAAVVGGVDSLCLTTLYGFASLELVSARPCRPCAPDRDGISIGEAAGFALLERPAAARDHCGVAVLGYGESADAYHISSPHPEGLGARLAMQRALASSGLAPAQIDYINMHGTATPANDLMEDRAIAAVFGTATPCSSTKGWTGHTLGAAGITDAVIGCLCIRHGLLPGNLNSGRIDPAFSSRVLTANRAQPVARVLSNSFGFGGSNCSLVFGAWS